MNTDTAFHVTVRFLKRKQVEYGVYSVDAPKKNTK